MIVGPGSCATRPGSALAVKCLKTFVLLYRSAVDHSLRGLRIPRPLNFDLGGGALDVAEIATGEFDGVGFKLIGRVRVSYEEGSWNEWYALFQDGRPGWVAEAQGFFMVSFETAAPAGR